MQARLTAGAAWASRQCQEMAYVEAIGTPTQLNPWAGRAAIQSAATTSVDRKTHLANSAYGVRLRGRNKEGEHEGQESHESQINQAINQNSPQNQNQNQNKNNISNQNRPIKEQESPGTK
ncbi:uncharacterized protein UV8b_05122 [Ustilaginoidea virens]|uniref:Uncharacterized protein n=1 Tax=Ustilaginoidea virens TaxID=1159556 RepID=A0A8E5MIC4_USTVR|nr:uncharacterized protein UV8b_05122 [Ustilaginoidea virens]QUC20881.1 hypothetical protein UV8b_05122 [Ustilaginoidea virens]